MSRASKWHLFLGLVGFASLLPFLAVPFVHHVVPEARLAQYVVTLTVLLGASFHVAASGWFYTDPDMRSHFGSRPTRYFVVPAALIIGSAVAFQTLDRALGNYLVAAYFAWQLWHFQKQNVGLLSFVAAGSDGNPLSVWERRTLMVAAVAGILGFFRFNDAGLSALTPEFAQLHRLGGAVYGLAAVLFAIALIKSAALRRNPLRIAFFLFGTAFFLPTYIFSHPLSALVGYGSAHGLQYLVFMGFVSVGRRNPAISLLLLVAIAAVGSFVLERAMHARDWLDFPYGYAVYGAALGAVMSHFVLDAGIWRLREPFQRAYMRAKFQFVFNR